MNNPFIPWTFSRLQERDRCSAGVLENNLLDRTERGIEERIQAESRPNEGISLKGGGRAEENLRRYPRSLGKASYPILNVRRIQSLLLQDVSP